MIHNITPSVNYIGVDDPNLDLFESQHILPDGMSYNSYLIHDNKICIFDTADHRVLDKWVSNLELSLGEKEPDYLVVSHMEPDHASGIKVVANKYPNMKVVGSSKTFTFIRQFFDIDLTGRELIVNENDTLELGLHKLRFIMAPMVHWPEVMVTYDEFDKILFSADAFGKFGIFSSADDWVGEARRYYFNIVGKFGNQTQALLKKIIGLDINTIAPLHGPVLKENIGYYIDKYNTWSNYSAEDNGILIAYASIYGNTELAAKELASILRDKGADNVILRDLTRGDMAKAVEDAFRHSTMVVASATYEGGLFPKMECFLNNLRHKGYKIGRASCRERV